MLSTYVEGTYDISCNPALKTVRIGKRSILGNGDHDPYLHRYVAGNLPYYYRPSDKIGEDFVGKHDAIEMVLSLFSQAPTTPEFQNSHFGEILASMYVEEILGFKRLYSKLTLTTAEDTNVHKMDGLFVDIGTPVFRYLFVEAKTSILPTEKSKFSGHRYGLLKRMIESIGSYQQDDKRFDLTRIRDNLSADFPSDIAKRIKADLVPPGPSNSAFLGIAVINSSTVNDNDDAYILTESCTQEFDFQGLVVTDLASLAKNAYAYGQALMNAAKG